MALYFSVVLLTQLFLGIFLAEGSLEPKISMLGTMCKLAIWCAGSLAVKKDASRQRGQWLRFGYVQITGKRTVI